MYRFVLVFLLLPIAAQARCVGKEDLYNRSVVIEKYGRGVGSGVLLNGDTVVTAYHVVDDVEKIWLRLPGELSLPVQAELVKSDKEADLALLKIQKSPLSLKTMQVAYPGDLYTNVPVFFAGYAHADPTRFGVIPGRYKAPAKLPGQKYPMASFIQLEQRVYGGDSGAGIYTCDGLLMGIEIGNQAHLGLPGRVAAVAPQYIQWFLRMADIGPAETGRRIQPKMSSGQVNAQ